MGNSALGARYGAKVASFGPCGASRGASTATAISTSTMTPPAAPSGWRRSIVSVLRIVDPRIEPDVEQVHEEVHDQEDDGHDEDHGLYRRVVALDHGLNERGAHARHDEDDLHDDEPAQEPAAPPADEGDRGQERIPERMAVDDGALGEALGARRAHVVLANHL